jgi:hypothetical protein
MDDWTRKQDLNELEELWASAPNSFWRDQYETQIRKILRESTNPAIRKYREELVLAVKNNDRRHVKYIQGEINHLMQGLTGGREIS